MISIKDYAKSHGVSYEAVRQQVSRYAGREIDGFRLSDHITKVDRTQYIDDEGADFLDARRAKNPVVIQQEERNETIERLREQVGELQARLIAEQDRYIKLMDEKHSIEMREQTLIADRQMIDDIKEKTAQAEARAEESEKARQQAEKAAEDARIQAEQAEAEAAKARGEADRLRERMAEAEKATEEERARVNRMENAGLLARIFRNW